MLLDLSESLACPRCGPPHGLIVLVERMEARRVLEGRLDCPRCESRYPLRGGEIDFSVATEPSSVDGAAGQTVTGPAAAAPDRTPDALEEDAIAVAALLGIRHGRGMVIVSPNLAGSAARIGELCGGCEILRLEHGSVPREQARGAAEVHANMGYDAVTTLSGIRLGPVPLLSGKAVGIALAGAEPTLLEEAARLLAPGARLVVLRPTPEALDRIDEFGFEIIAADSRAIVAQRG